MYFKLPYIYTPAALTPVNSAIYRECIRFLKEHDNEKQFTCRIAFGSGAGGAPLRVGHVYTGQVSEMLADTSISVKDKLSILENASRRKDLELELKSLSNRLFNSNIKCARFHRDDDMVLFYKMQWNFTMGLDGLTGPGVLYSLDGRNPNETDNVILNSYKPFIQIDNNWYMSRHLMLQGPRFMLNHASMPESLFDHSLRTDVVSFELDPSAALHSNTLMINRTSRDKCAGQIGR